MNEGQKQGRLVVIEGIDGAGKSTVLRALAEECRQKGRPFVTSREPTTGKWGRLLRESGRTGRLSLDQELELFIQDRAEHVLTLIGPSLAKGEIVLLDRYYFSTAAYQGARGADPQAILEANEKFAPPPDLVLLLDLDPLSGLTRIAARGDTPDDFEEAAALARVREIFLSIHRPFIKRIDAARPAQVVAAEALAIFERVIAGAPRVD